MYEQGEALFVNHVPHHRLLEKAALIDNCLTEVSMGASLYVYLDEFGCVNNDKVGVGANRGAAEDLVTH